MLTIIWLAVVVVGAIALAYSNAAGWAWTLATAAALVVAALAHLLPPLALLVFGAALLLLAIPLNWPTLRRKLVSDGLLNVFRKVMPPMSQTERDAIEAGTVWWDGDLFSGRPDWRRLLDTPVPRLTDEERRFLDHDVEELCAMVTDLSLIHI